MFKPLLVATAATLIAGAGAAQATDVTDAGAAVPQAVYSKWAHAYKAETGPQPLQARPRGPVAAGGVVPVVNIPGVAAGQVRLTGPVLADIYLGNITRWNAPQIARLNPGVPLPDMAITVVHRSDGSGATLIYSSYLSRVSPTWAKEVGASEAVAWKVGLGDEGDSGVAGEVARTPGSIGYVATAYASRNKLAYTRMMNDSGRYVRPLAGGLAAAAGADPKAAAGDFLPLANQPAVQAWPISGAAFNLAYRKQAYSAAGESVLKVFDGAYKDVDPAAPQLDDSPLPLSVKNLIRRRWADGVGDPDGKVDGISH